MKKNTRTLIIIMLILISFSIINLGDSVQAGPVQVDWDRDGYIKPHSRLKRGEILFVSPEEVEIKTESGREKYRLDQSTTYTKRGEYLSINSIKEGDKALIYFDSIYTDIVSMMKIEDEEQHISGLLKGRIDMVDRINGEIWIKTPMEYKNGKWTPSMRYSLKLKSNGEKLYNGSREISLKELSLLRGREVYIAYDMSYGKYNIAKLRIKNGFANQYEGKVFSIEYNTGHMIVSNNLIGFDASTIVIKDNRLVDNLNIDKGRSISLVGERSGSQNMSSIVSIKTDILEDRLDKNNIYVYRGKIENIFDYEIEIGKINYRKDYLKLEDNVWKGLEEPKRFFFSSDTLVYDSELKANIEPEYLWNSRYINLQDIKDKALKARIEANYYKGKQAYFVTREGQYGSEVLAINLTPYKHYYGGNVTLNHSIQGEIEEVDYENKSLTVKNVKTYNSLNSTWQVSEDEKIDISKGVVMLNDNPIDLEDIYNVRTGSRVNIIKEKTSSLDEGYVIFIED